MSEPLWQPRSEGAARLLGAGFFAGGAALAGFQIKVVLDAVAAHAERVNYFLSALVLGEMALVLGLYWLVRGLAGYAAIRSLRDNPRAKRTVMITAAVVAGGTIVAMKIWLGSLGYGD